METLPGNKPTATAVADPTDDWYEHGFARVEGSRKRGVTSMPLPYAQTLMKWASYVPGADLSGMLVIDPACGSGNTLIAATQALAARGRTRRWGAERVAQEIERCIWGLDPDPVACHVTDLRLRRMIAHVIPDLPAARRKTLQLHIHQTDSLTLPADARFKLVITNPPLATARGVVVSYGGFEAKTPPRDVWLKFLEQSMGLTAWGGLLAIALPEAFLAKPSAAALRAELLQDWTLEHLAHVTGVFRSGPGTVLLLLRRTPPDGEAQTQWERIERLSLARMAYLGEDGEEKPAETAEERPRTIHSRSARAERRREGTLPQAEMAKGRGPWRYALGKTERAFLAKLEQPHGAIGRARMGDLVTVARGAEISKDAAEPSLAPIAGGAQILRASEIVPFTATPRAWLPASAFKVPADQWRALKIVLPRASARPQAALDESGVVPVSAVLTLHLAQPDVNARETLLMVVALLNSAPLRAYLALTQTAYLLARPTIDADALRALPIALGTSDVRQRLANLAVELGRHYATYGTTTHDAAQDAVAQRLEKTLAMEVNALYHLTDEEQGLAQRWLL